MHKKLAAVGVDLPANGLTTDFDQIYDQNGKFLQP